MEWTRGHTIGQGSTATVSMATTATTSGGRKTFAVKSIELSKSEFLQREKNILSTLNHPYIVAYKGYDVTTENNKLMFNLKMPYFPGGTLSDAVKRAGGRLEESTISFYTRQIVEGLDYLHSIGVMHCDIKGQNILLGQNGATIADFGCAKKRDSPAMNIAGTPLFMAPEVARGEEQGYPADIWALGCTVLEMATGCCSPWPNATNVASLLYSIGNTEDMPEIPQCLSDQTKDFMKMCLKRDPKERLTAKELMKHKFLDEYSDNSKGKIQDLCSLSPTSILEQGMWSSVYESKTVIRRMIPENSMVSPARQLGLRLFDSCVPNWTWDGQWITVRSS